MCGIKYLSINIKYLMQRATNITKNIYQNHLQITITFYIKGDKEMKTTKLNTITVTLSKIIAGISCGGAALTAIGTVLVGIYGNVISEYLTKEIESGSLSINYQTAFIRNGAVSASSFVFYMILLTVDLILNALIFSNIAKVFSTGKKSPFSEENVKRIKNVGYFALAMPIANLIIPTIGLLFKANAYVGFQLSDFLFGFVALCLSQFFAYGASLEKDVEGLL